MTDDLGLTPAEDDAQDTQTAEPTTAVTAAPTAHCFNQERLAEIDEALKKHELCRAKARAEQIDHIMKMGRLLIEARKLLGHGSFMDWVQVTYPFSESSHQTALNYMSLAEAYDAGLVKFKTILNLGLGEAYKHAREELARDRSPDAGRKSGTSKQERAKVPQRQQSNCPFTMPQAGQVLQIEWGTEEDNSRKNAWVWVDRHQPGKYFEYLLGDGTDDKKKYVSTYIPDSHYSKTWEQMAYGILRAFGGDGPREQHLYEFNPAIRSLLRELGSKINNAWQQEIKRHREKRKLEEEHQEQLKALERKV